MSSTKIATAQPHSFQSGAFSFMSCTSGREGSPLDETSPQPTDFKTETKKKRFHPLRNLRRMFRRKTRRSCISADSYQPGVPDNPEISSTNLEQRSCSTSRLQEENLTQNLIRNSRLNPGLSLSHDSIFTPDRADSGLSSSDLENSSLSITVLTTPTKSFPIKSQSSCSESSLLSIGSSETELTPNQSGKLSDLDVGVTSYKLSHSAAKHKMAVKPRRNHGAPRNRRRPMVSTSPLPITLETGEEGVTERSSSQFVSDITISSSPPKTDKSPSETKISWNHPSADLSGKEQELKSEKTEDESDAKKEEVTGQKNESFFGRFLSRRSDKKKKQVPEMNSEDREEEKHHYVKKCSKPVEGKGRVVKSPSHRQRVEPVEIPYGLNPNTGEPVKRRLPSPVSPSKGSWTSPTTSHSTSPQKVAWFENASHLKPTESCSAVWDNPKADISEPTEDLKKDLKNSNFVKELSDCISSMSREVAGKRKIDEEDLGGGESVLKIRRQLSEEETKQKSPNSENILVSKIKSISLESMESFKNSEEHKTSEDGANLIKNACDFNLRTLSVSFDAIHDGYENIQIIERVKQEVKDLETQPSEAEKKLDVSIQQEKPTEIEFENKEISVDKEPKKIVKRVKPLVSEKPKDLKRIGGQDLLKLNINRVSSSPESTINTPEGVVPKTKTTLIERRKSELLLLTDVEEKNWKAKIKPLKKQTSFSETKSEEGVAEETKKIPLSPEKTEISPEMVAEVVLRKKSASVSDEQPELMKVFARRSLKVRESEKLAEEVQKSRDSDKENEMIESPREEKKKGGCKEEMKEWESISEGSRTPVGEKATDEMVVGVPLLKPEIASRKNLVHKYGRSLSENNSKSPEDSTILEENKLNNLRSVAETCKLERKGIEEKEEETGFKRIQQRKAEWERRAQQGAK